MKMLETIDAGAVLQQVLADLQRRDQRIQSGNFGREIAIAALRQTTVRPSASKSDQQRN